MIILIRILFSGMLLSLIVFANGKMRVRLITAIGPQDQLVFITHQTIDRKIIHSLLFVYALCL